MDRRTGLAPNCDLGLALLAEVAAFDPLLGFAEERLEAFDRAGRFGAAAFEAF